MQVVRHFKDAAKLVKAHMSKLNKARPDLIGCPYQGYLQTLDEMAKYTAMTANFVKTLTTYQKKFSNLSDIYEHSRGLAVWRMKSSFEYSFDVFCLLTKATIAYAALTKDVDLIQVTLVDLHLDD
jgi:hypothetical protein